MLTGGRVVSGRGGRRGGRGGGRRGRGRGSSAPDGTSETVSAAAPSVQTTRTRVVRAADRLDV